MSLIGHWTLTEDNYSGGKFQDLTANNNDGTPANAPVFTTNQQSRANRATVFNGSSDKIALSSFTGISSIQGSISFWAKFAALGANERIIDIVETAYTDYLRLGKGNNNKMTIAIEDGNVIKTTLSTDNIVSDTDWHHFIFLQDGVSLKIYIDNVLQAVSGTNSAYWTSHLTIASCALGANFLGYLDGAMANIRFYNHALTEAERTNIYNSELFWHQESITGQMDFAGRLSAQNPKWLLLDKSLNWIGEWDALYSYNINDTILYKIADGNEWHIFISKTNHNVGNVPTTTAAHWRRYYQEQYL